MDTALQEQFDRFGPSLGSDPERVALAASMVASASGAVGNFVAQIQGMRELGVHEDVIADQIMLSAYDALVLAGPQAIIPTFAAAFVALSHARTPETV